MCTCARKPGMSQRVHICLCAVIGVSGFERALRLCCFYINLSQVPLQCIRETEVGWNTFRGVNSLQGVQRAEARAMCRPNPAQPSSECSDRHNLFYAFNLEGLVTYIPSSHLFAFYGWTLFPSVLFAFFLFFLTQYTHFGSSSEFGQAVKCSKSTNCPSARKNQCAGRFTRANNLRALWKHFWS